MREQKTLLEGIWKVAPRQIWIRIWFPSTPIGENIELMILRAREIGLPYARFAKIGDFRVPAEESHGPARDTQPNLALCVAFVSC